MLTIPTVIFCTAVNFLGSRDILKLKDPMYLLKYNGIHNIKMYAQYGTGTLKIQ